MPKKHNSPQALFSKHRGILGLDEGLDRLRDRFVAARFSLTPANQRRYLELMIQSPGLNSYISAITLGDQGARLLTSEADIFAQLVVEKGFLLGIRADLGFEKHSLFSRQVVTRGIIGLDERLEEYRDWGAHYALWRNKYYIQGNSPTQAVIEANNAESVEFLSLCMKHSLTPVLQVKVSTNGNQTVQATAQIMAIIFEDLFARIEVFGLDPEEFIIQTNFVTPGRFAKESRNPDQVAKDTLTLFEQSLPSTIAGISLVCDGLKPGFGRLYLEKYRALAAKRKWKTPTTFSFGRGLHDNAMQAWGGNSESSGDAQVSLVQNCRLDWLANQ